jgi:hypothetical protein
MESIIVLSYKTDNKTDRRNYRDISLLSTSNRLVSNILLSRLSLYIDKIIGIVSVGFDLTDQLLIRFFSFFTYWKKKKCEYNETMHKLFIDFKKAYDSVRREVLYNILIVWSTMKLVRLIKMCLNKIYSKGCISKLLSDIFPIQNGLKQDVLSPLL